MKKIISLFVLSFSLSYAYSQLVTMTKKDSVNNGIAYVNKQAADLSEMGVEFKNDSLVIREEVIRLLKDEEYRKTVYPENYEWPVVVASFRNMEFKKAFWQLLNLYETDKPNRDLIVNLFCAYDSLFIMDKALVNTFYTYALVDPKVCRITDNKPDIFRPDLLEKKMGAMREIIGYVLAYRKQQAALKKS